MVWLTPVLGIVMMCVECVEGAPKKVGQKAGTNQQTRQEKSTKKHRLRQASVRKDRAYAFEARLSSLDGAGCFEPGGTDRELLRYSGAEPLELAPGDGVLVPVEREVQSSADGSLTEAVFPVDCGVEAVPGLWTTGAAEGFVLLAGLVETAACDCGAVETNFLSVGEEGPCETCVARPQRSVERTAVRSYQGRRSGCTRVGVFGVLAAVSALLGGGSYERPVEDPAVVTFLGNIPKENSWWDAPGGVASAPS